MRHDDWAILARCIDALAVTVSTASLASGQATAPAVTTLFISLVLALAFAVADGIVGSWRDRRDAESRRQAYIMAEKNARARRRARALRAWEERS